MPAASIPARAARTGPLRSRRLLALAGDARLVEQVRRGNEAAFEVVFERHGPAILAFCRHMLGSAEDAEDAVQHTFAAAYRDLQLGEEREIALKSWLFAIARNRCLSLLRARRDVPAGAAAMETGAVATAGLADEVEQRADLRRLLADVRELPDEPRAALLLTELGDLSHAEVAGVLGCEVRRVKALVFRARSQLIARREAREAPCERIREQLANLRGGSLRRTELRLGLAVDQVALEIHHTHHGVAGAELAQQVERAAEVVRATGPALHLDLVLKVGRGGTQVVLEAVHDAPLSHRAHHDREQAEDREGERGGHDRHLQLHREARPHASSLST